MFELFIARRYLRAKRQQVVISVITVISVIGVAVGVMALVIAIAVTNGLHNTTQRTFLAATAHVMVTEKERGAGIEGWEALAAKLSKIPGVQSATPALYDTAFINGPINSQGIGIKGISVSPGSYQPDILQHLKSGSLADLQAKDVPPGIILGVEIAKLIGAEVGTRVRLLIPNGNLTAFGPRPSSEEVRVAGIFESGMYNYDSQLTFMALSDVQKLWDYPDIVNSIELNISDINRAPEIAQAAEKLVPKTLGASPWQEQNKQLLAAFELERTVAVITIGLIQLVAALNILTVLVMMVMEKHRDIAILMSMGARASQIRRIFILKGVMIGAVGTVIGLILGYGISFLSERYELFPLDQTAYQFKYLPFESDWRDAIWISAAAIAISLLATLYPARSAAKIAPVESMRYE